MKRSTMAILAAIVSTGVAQADELSLPIQDAAVALDGRGSARIFFRVDNLPASPNVLVDRAMITVPYSGTVEDRSFELRVCPVTSAWGAQPSWDTPYDDELYARADFDLRRSAGAMSFDVTVAVNASREHGMFADGFVMTLGRDRARGIRVQDLGRLASLAGVTMKVTTTHLPSGRPSAQWIQRHGS